MNLSLWSVEIHKGQNSLHKRNAINCTTSPSYLHFFHSIKKKINGPNFLHENPIISMFWNCSVFAPDLHIFNPESYSDGPKGSKKTALILAPSLMSLHAFGIILRMTGQNQHTWHSGDLPQYCYQRTVLLSLFSGMRVVVGGIREGYWNKFGNGLFWKWAAPKEFSQRGKVLEETSHQSLKKWANFINGGINKE